ncbi:hypothetical protein Sjap_004577 [Stephania japonica]|uniref:Uncharacterized protein n=1 Tax=Stephania japonica TaxID=461633 RepID=A0AAP0K3P6_9MAGN
MNASLVLSSNSQAMEEYQDLVALLEAHLAIVEEMVVKLQCTISGDVRLTPFYDINDVTKKLHEYIDDINANIEKLDSRGPVSKYILPDENLRGKYVLLYVSALHLWMKALAFKLQAMIYLVVGKTPDRYSSLISGIFSIENLLVIIHDPHSFDLSMFCFMTFEKLGGLGLPIKAQPWAPWLINRKSLLTDINGDKLLQHHDF